MKVIVAVDGARGLVIADGLAAEGIEVVAVLAASTPAQSADGALCESDSAEARHALAEAESVVLQVTRESLTAPVVALFDRLAIRIVPLCASVAAERLAAVFALMEPVSIDSESWQIADAITAVPLAATNSGREQADAPLIVVWGPAGAPGRSTVAIELAVELARGGRHIALVDADTHAPSIAVALGLADEGPGFAAACRQAELGGLDARELTRISAPLERGGVDVLTGINRPSRWPELSETRVQQALAHCREWADHTVVDVAAPLERDEEIVSDLAGPRRNAATLAALRSADLVVAVASADPVGVSRFLRGYAELRATVGGTRVAVVVNRLRPGALGVDARGQVRRALERFGGIDDVWFLPMDPRSTDAALLAGGPIADVAPRSPFTLALRRFVGDAIAPVPERTRNWRWRRERVPG